MYKWLLLLLALPFAANIEPAEEVIVLPPTHLDRNPTAIHVGDGDEELKRIETTHLTGHFSLQLEHNTLVGELNTTIEETFIRPGNRVDGTKFLLQRKYLIYTPPPGYRIKNFQVLYNLGLTSTFNFWQRNYGGQWDCFSSGPLNAIWWTGDTGEDHDQKKGCYVYPRLKGIQIWITTPGS